MKRTPAPVPDYVTTAWVVDVYDGDTITVARDLGHNIFFITKIRLLGIDTPERRGKTKAWGMISRQHLIDLISETTDWKVFKTPWGEHRFPKLILRSTKPDKYGGRWLGELWLPGGPVQLNLQMLDDGYARAYEGGHKTPYPLQDLPQQPG